MMSPSSDVRCYVGFNGGCAFCSQDLLSLFSSDYSDFKYSANGWLFGGGPPPEKWSDANYVF